MSGHQRLAENFWYGIILSAILCCMKSELYELKEDIIWKLFPQLCSSFIYSRTIKFLFNDSHFKDDRYCPEASMTLRSLWTTVWCSALAINTAERMFLVVFSLVCLPRTTLNYLKVSNSMNFKHLAGFPQNDLLQSLVDTLSSMQGNSRHGGLVFGLKIVFV